MNKVYDRYQKPLFIVENGLGEIDKADENGYVEDDYRIEYLQTHFAEIKKAVEIDKIPVIGYTMWGGVDLVSLSTGEMKKDMDGSMLILVIWSRNRKKDTKEIILLDERIFTNKWRKYKIEGKYENGKISRNFYKNSC